MGVNPRHSVRQLVFYLSLLLFWQLLYSAKIWPHYLFPGPLPVFSVIAKGFADGTFISAIFVSLKRLFTGFCISIFLGLIFGMLIAYSRLVKDTFGKLVTSLQTLPSISWFPAAILWFGLSETTIIFITVMGSIFSITISVESAIRGIPVIYLKTARNMGAKGWKMFWWVLVPASGPSIVSGLKQGWSFAWRSLLAGELLLVSLGLGYLLMMARELNDINRVVAVILVIMTLSILIEKFVFSVLEARIRKRWGL